MKKGLLSLCMMGLGITMLVGCSKAVKNGEVTQSSKEKLETSKSEEVKKLIVGTEAGFAPYEYIGEGGEIVGVDMDIVKEVAKELGYELEIKNMDFDGALLAVQSGKVDLVAAGVSIDEDRQKTMDFSNFYVDSNIVVVVNKDNAKVKAATNDDLVGKVVGVQQGNTADLYVSKIKDVDVKQYPKFLQAAEDLKNGKIDCIVMDEIPAKKLVETAGGSLSILDGVLYKDQFALVVDKGNQELLDKVNPILDKLIQEGKIQEFLDNHTGK